MGAAVLGGEVAAAGAGLPDEPAPSASTTVTTAPGTEGAEPPRPVTLGAVVAEQLQGAADRPDGEVDVAVVVVVGRGEAPAVARFGGADVEGPHRAAPGGDDLEPLGVLREARDRDRAVRKGELEAPVEVEVRPRRPSR